MFGDQLTKMIGDNDIPFDEHIQMLGDYLPYIILTLRKDRINMIPPTWFQLG